MTRSSPPPPTRSRYLRAATAPEHYPSLQVPEFCFIGRSNAGKSTLINRLTRRRRLAHTSRTPGRTQAIHFFDIDGRLAFADLPGWGYAAVPKAQRAQFEPMVRTYVETRANLCGAVLIVDIRRQPGPQERAFADLVTGRERMLLVAVSKVDKLPKHARAARLDAIARDLEVPTDALFPYAGLTGAGCDDIWRAIDELARSFDRRRPGRFAALKRRAGAQGPPA